MKKSLIRSMTFHHDQRTPCGFPLTLSLELLAAYDLTFVQQSSG